MIQTGIISVSLEAIREAGLWPNLCLILLLQLLGAYFSYLRSWTSLQQMQYAEANMVDLLQRFIMYAALFSGLEFVTSCIGGIIKRRTLVKLKSVVRKRGYILLETNDLYKTVFELEPPQIVTAITTGANAVNSLVNCCLSLVKSLMTVFAVITTINAEVKIPIYGTYIGISAIFIMGILVQVSNYIARKENNKKTNHIDTLKKDVVGTIVQDRFNGDCESATKSLSMYSDMRGFLDLELDIATSIKMTALECGIVITILYSTLNVTDTIIAEKGSPMQAIVIGGLIASASWRMWGVFSSVTAAQNSMAQFASMQQVLEEYVPEGTYIPRYFRGMDIIIEAVSQEKYTIKVPLKVIIQLHGPSGCGKTVGMKILSIQLKRYYPDVIIRYMEQTPAVIESDSVTIAQWFLGNSEHNSKDVETIIGLADFLGLDKQVSHETLNKPFVKPSPGQKKRLMFIKLVYGAYRLTELGHYVFLIDELLAGLDEQSRNSALKIIDELRNRGANFIIIDHHSIALTDVIKLEVISEPDPPTKSAEMVTQELSITQKILDKCLKLVVISASKKLTKKKPPNVSFRQI